jgi:hypothetical protein
LLPPLLVTPSSSSPLLAWRPYALSALLAVTETAGSTCFSESHPRFSGGVLRGVRKAAVLAWPYAETYTQRPFPGVGSHMSDGSC